MVPEDVSGSKRRTGDYRRIGMSGLLTSRISPDGPLKRASRKIADSAGSVNPVWASRRKLSLSVQVRSLPRGIQIRICRLRPFSVGSLANNAVYGYS